MNLIILCSAAVSVPNFFLGGQIAAVNVCAGCVACTLNILGMSIWVIVIFIL